MDADTELIRIAGDLADAQLFPHALEADRSGEVPTRQLDLLAKAGLFGASVQTRPETVTRLIEIVAGGCLTTAFVWTQHLGAAEAANSTTGPANRLTTALAAGDIRGGVAFAHMLRPGPPQATAEPTDQGWLYHGRAPWVTGWGHIDVLLAAARHGDDVVWALIDAADAPTLSSHQPELAAMDSTRTVELTFDAHPVPADRVTSVVDFDTWRARYRLGLRNNGSFPLGVAGRCCRLLERPKLDRRLDEIRDRLDSASPDELPEARADAALFAVTASTALVSATGGRAITMAHHAQRLHRESMFLLAQGQTPQIKAHLLDRLESR